MVPDLLYCTIEHMCLNTPVSALQKMRHVHFLKADQIHFLKPSDVVTD